MPVDNRNCRDCFYFQGQFDENCCCNYLLITGYRRPCPPGEGCAVKKPRGCVRRMADQRRAEKKAEKARQWLSALVGRGGEQDSGQE